MGHWPNTYITNPNIYPKRGDTHEKKLDPDKNSDL